MSVVCESSTCSAALADSVSDSSAPACEPSPFANASPTPEPYSESTGPTCPATTTCEHSRQTDWLETESASISYAEGSRVRTSALQAREPAWQANAPGYGASSPVLLVRYDLDSSSWKTSQHCLVEGLETYSETWPRSGLMRNGTAYRLPPLVPLTGGTESGLLPTPEASNTKAVALRSAGRSPRNFLVPIPTPRPCSGLRSSGANRAEILRAVHRWPTPVARDYKGQGMSVARRATRPPDNLCSAVKISDGSGALNPTWVEWLMGFPAEWTALDASATPSSRKSRKRSGGQS